MRYLLVSTTLLISAVSQANLLTNGSFEEGPAPSGFVPDSQGGMQLNTGSTAIPGWTVTGDQIAWLHTTNFWGITASDQTKSLDLSGYTDSGSAGGIEQTFATVPSQQYLVQFDIGAQQPSWGPTDIIVSAASQSATFQAIPTGSQQWTTKSWIFTANSAFTTLNFSENNPSRTAYNGLDNAIVTAVPEPASILGLVLGGAYFIRRRRN